MAEENVIRENGSAVSGVRWLEDFEDALRRANEVRRPVLLEFFRPDCSGCIKMDKDVFSLKEIATEVIRKFVPIRLNILQNPILRARYNAVWTPSFYFLNRRGDAVWFIEGALNAEDFQIAMGIGEVRLLLPVGDYSHAADILESLIKTYPSNPRVPHLLMLKGMAYYLRYRDKDVFHAAMSEIAEEHPQSPEARMWPWEHQYPKPGA